MGFPVCVVTVTNYLNGIVVQRSKRNTAAGVQLRARNDSRPWLTYRIIMPLHFSEYFIVKTRRNKDRLPLTNYYNRLGAKHYII